VLSPARRHEIVAWAHDVDGYVIEDDYDAEYRYDRHPIGAMQGLAPDRVIYSGTLSKSLAPGLRLGWLVLPQPLVGPIADCRTLVDRSTSTPVQTAFAEFLLDGHLDRHLRRMRRVYRQRRDALVGALAKWLPDAKPSGIAAGLHLFVTMPAEIDEVELTDRAAAAGVLIYPVHPYRVKVSSTTPEFILGYGNLTPERIDEGVRMLADVVAGLRPATRSVP
jgi:GntR family transcriptional regulator/MocR family aminotransferase